MRVIAYKMLTHARMVGYIRFIDGNKLNYNKNNLERVDFNHVLNDILDKKDTIYLGFSHVNKKCEIYTISHFLSI